jgi:SAM-dependent methyltransferase
VTASDDRALAVAWHDVECGSYRADLPLWDALARETGGPVLELGAGTGRVALSLARAGHEVVAVDRDPALVAALRERAAGYPLCAVQADAREFGIDRLFALCLAPMQLMQLVGGAAQRRRVLQRVRAHLVPSGVFAAAVTTGLEPFDERSVTPLPDVRERDGMIYASRPVALRETRAQVVLERVRELVGPDGSRTETRDVVRLARVSPTALAREARALGFTPREPRHVPPTAEHVGSDVVVLRA